MAGLAIALVYLSGTTGRWEPSPDSAIYLGLARSLAQGQGYQFNGQPNNTVTPGLPWVLAAVQAAFGEPVFFANLLVVLCALAGLAMVHRSIALLSDRRTALAVALGTAFSYPVFHTAHRVLTDVPFLLLFWAMFYCSRRGLRGSWGWLGAAALLSAAGIVVRAPGGLLIGPFAAGLLLDRGPARRRVALAAATFLAALGTGLVFWWLACKVSTQTPAYLAGSLGDFWSSDRPGQLVTGLVNLPDATAELFTSQGGKAMIPLGLAILALAAIGLGVLWKKGLRSFTVVMVGFPILLILLGGYQSIRPRYLIPVLPILIYAAVEGLRWIVDDKVRARRPAAPGTTKARLLAVNILVGVIVLANLPKVAVHAFYYQAISHYPDYYQKLRHGQHADLMAVGELLRRQAAERESVAAQPDDLSLLHYVTRRRIVPFPLAEPLTAQDASRALEFLKSRPDLKFIITETPGKDSPTVPFWDALREGLRRVPGSQVIYEGRQLQVVRRP